MKELLCVKDYTSYEGAKLCEETKMQVRRV